MGILLYAYHKCIVLSKTTRGQVCMCFCLAFFMIIYQYSTYKESIWHGNHVLFMPTSINQLQLKEQMIQYDSK